VRFNDFLYKSVVPLRLERKITSTTGAVSTHSYAVFSHGQGYYILNTTAGAPNVVIGEARKQNPKTAESHDDR